MPIRCPKGHWYDPELTGGGCPKCAAEKQPPPPISDDDVLAIMSSSQTGGGVITEEENEDKKSSGSAIMRRKKVCPECAHEASFSFVYCPRCGAPLQVASVKL